MGIIATGKQSKIIFSSFQIVYKINCWFPANESNVLCYNLFWETGPMGCWYASGPLAPYRCLWYSSQRGELRRGCSVSGLILGFSLVGSGMAQECRALRRRWGCCLALSASRAQVLLSFI